MKVGVVGTGALGRHHVRHLAALADADLVGVFDLRPEVAQAQAREHGTRSFATLAELLEQIDAAVVAVPTEAHVPVGLEVLERGRHLLVEKPIARSLDEADRLIAARRAGQVLAVGHVEFFNPAVRTLLGQGSTPRFVAAERLAPFSPRSLDVDVLLDLMIHDLQLLHALDPSPVVEVRATGVEVLSDRIDIANARLELASGLVANLTASRVSAEGTRKLRVFMKHHYYSIDFHAQEIKGYGLSRSGEGRQIVPDDLPVVKCDQIRAELSAFLAACRGERDAVLVDGGAARRSLATALAVRDAIG